MNSSATLTGSRVEIVDWRARHDGTKVSQHRGRVLERDPRDVDSVTLHQTACVFGPASDREKRLARAMKIGAHATAFREGVGVLAMPLRWQGIHANALNATSIGLEIEGLYAGLQDDPTTAPREDLRTTWGRPPLELTELVVETARALLTRIVELAAAEGIELRYVRAHRQASGARRSDPGEGLWRAVALEHAVARLGLRVEPDRTWVSKSSGEGRPIPEAWGGGAGVQY
ncbi:N-acetylmuramoyl-L-alanine amidase [Sandaracinus amylolyticus]|uniref:peptidoglycan recognition protein family protein n=1 Tax=Sandaracinus amylolyticus TaxID=927083 RepID=UPI00069EB7CE|nr:N-acetylmuramoyl-L-alanine amidase [Sandaracinus amylolyticus]